MIFFDFFFLIFFLGGGGVGKLSKFKIHYVVVL